MGSESGPLICLPQMLGELVERLETEFDSAEADGGVALLFGRMELAQGHDGLPVALFVEGDRHVEPPRIVVLVGAMIKRRSGSGLAN